jgi:hypothetical protein
MLMLLYFASDGIDRRLTASLCCSGSGRITASYRRTERCPLFLDIGKNSIFTFLQSLPFDCVYQRICFFAFNFLLLLLQRTPLSTRIEWWIVLNKHIVHGLLNRRLSIQCFLERNSGFFNVRPFRATSTGSWCMVDSPQR